MKLISVLSNTSVRGKFGAYLHKMDRRTKSRIDVQLTCFIGAGKVLASPLRMLTRNVSRNGILMRWLEGTPLPSLNSKLTLDVALPENSEFGARLMRCRATVVRVIFRHGEEAEVALRIQKMSFIQAKVGTRNRIITVRDLASMPVLTEHVV
jgi:c-di-GMP-binding flagellar brake protein YcgR